MYISAWRHLPVPQADSAVIGGAGDGLTILADNRMGLGLRL